MLREEHQLAFVVPKREPTEEREKTEGDADGEHAHEHRGERNSVKETAPRRNYRDRAQW
jgi:hypothetical protein